MARRRHKKGTAPRLGFVGDWPAGYHIGYVPVGHHEGVGPDYVEEPCEACGLRIRTTGECGCS